MDLIIFANDLYNLVPVTKEMLQNISIPKGTDCFDLCNIIRENFTTYIINNTDLFYGCICGD
jgi:hypothetical protein